MINIENICNKATTLHYLNPTDWNDFVGYKVMNSDLFLYGYKDTKLPPLNISSVNGRLVLIDCVFSNQLKNLRRIGGLELISTQINKFSSLKSITGDCYLKRSHIADASTLCEVCGDIILDHSYIDNMKNLRRIGGSKYIVEEPEEVEERKI